MLYLLFLKSGKILICRLLQIIGGALRVNFLIIVIYDISSTYSCLFLTSNRENKHSLHVGAL